MDAGELATDEIVLGLIRERLGRPDAAHGFILDGYPRNVAQAGALDRLLAELGQPIDAVVLMKVDEKALVMRADRASHAARTCGKVLQRLFVAVGQGRALRQPGPRRGAAAAAAA